MFTSLDRTIGKVIFGLNSPRLLRNSVYKIRTRRVDFENERYHQVIYDCINPRQEPISFTGFDRSIFTASRKALSELAEAYSFWTTDLPWEVSRSGFASHVSRELAADNAYLELVERDAFLMHFLVPELQTEVITEHKIQNSQFNFVTVKLQTSDPSVFCTLTATRIKDEPWSIGLGSGRTLDSAALRSQLECSMVFNDWTAKELIIPNRQTPRLQTLRKHFESTSFGRAKESIDSMLGSLGKKQMAFRTSQDQLVVQRYWRYGRKLHSVQCAHPNLIPISFGEYWLGSETYIASLISKRGFKSTFFELHPLI